MDNKIAMLAAFLKSTIINDYGFNFYRDWVAGKISPEFDRIASNNYGLIRKNECIYVYSTNDPLRKRYVYFNASKEQMVRIIDEWTKIAFQKPQPNLLFITKEKNGEVKFSVLE